ncbi:hypothetical protein BN1079_00033 [Pseudomonas saudiphocaensis]|uniref:Uncharacterized protein n=1 Tax=Pseudomonas saudiphocaensis TaxID=1499686 RepID=A0A078LSE1_9PSED|nr:hypothetical protein BN1079_00033 [Pseudomonas saudiphocaensis]
MHFRYRMISLYRHRIDYDHCIDWQFVHCLCNEP